MVESVECIMHKDLSLDRLHPYKAHPPGEAVHMPVTSAREVRVGGSGG